MVLWNQWTHSRTSAVTSHLLRLISICAKQSHGQQSIGSLSIIWKSDLSNKLKNEFLLSCGSVNTTVRMHYTDANKRYNEKGLWKLHKCVISCIEHINTKGKISCTTTYLTLISKNILIRQTSHRGHCW